jgi:mono/diheme cytochrome c family protein
MIKFIVGIIVGICLVLVAAYLFATQGGIQMGVRGGPATGEHFLASHAIEASIGNSTQDKSPLPADDTNLLAGADVYMHHGCAGCHGQLDKPDSGMGSRFYPHAPHLLAPPRGGGHAPVGATHWVVKNGLRFSGMPTFEGNLTDNQIWQVSLLLGNVGKLPPAVQDALRK